MLARRLAKYQHMAEDHSPVPAAITSLARQREHSSGTQRLIRNAVRYKLENRQLMNIDEAMRKASRITDRKVHARRTVTAHRYSDSCHVSRSSASSKLVEREAGPIQHEGSAKTFQVDQSCPYLAFDLVSKQQHTCLLHPNLRYVVWQRSQAHTSHGSEYSVRFAQFPGILVSSRPWRRDVESRTIDR